VAGEFFQNATPVSTVIGHRRDLISLAPQELLQLQEIALDETEPLHAPDVLQRLADPDD
jgi:hypothetical protein